MSQEKVLKTLESVGLNQSDAQVYIFLGKRGAQKAKDIATALKMPKNLLYLALKNLQAKGVVNATLEKPARFSAEPFERVLDIFVGAKLEEAKKIETNKAEILSDWKSIAVGISSDKSPKFTVLEGRNCIYSRLKRMAEETKREMLIISTVPGIIRAEKSGLLDLFKPKIKIKFLTELSEQDVTPIQHILGEKRRADYEGRVPELGLRLFTRIMIRDGEEATFFLTNDEKSYNQDEDICLWTNCQPLVDSFSAVFENLWTTSISIEQKILQLQNGEDPLRTRLISDSQTAQDNYDEAINLAQKEIVLITSPSRFDYEEKRKILEKKAIDGVSIKIMVPITGKNFYAAGRLSEFCEIRHIPPSYTDTTLIDGEYLFQFKSPFPEQNNVVKNYFQNTSYVNDVKYIEKTATMIHNIWEKAYAPLFFKPEKTISTSDKPGTVIEIEEKRNKAYGRVFNFIERPNIPIEISEKEILNRIMNSKRRSARNCQKNGITFYGSIAQGFIHPPDYFELPDMMFQVFHNKAQSTFGVAIVLVIYVKTITNQGFTYGPAVSVHTNQWSAKFYRTINVGTIVEKNTLLFKKGEVEVREQGNTLFLGWTKPIQLPGKGAIPPSSLLFEGYGEIRTNAAKLAVSNGWQVLCEANSLEAFMTFYHPSSKYSGPGTDGIFFRDSITTWVPPSKSSA